MKDAFSRMWDVFRGDGPAAMTIPITFIRHHSGGWMATYDNSQGRAAHYFGIGDSTNSAKLRLVEVLQDAIARDYAATPFEHEEIIHG